MSDNDIAAAGGALRRKDTDLMRLALEALIWMGGSGDFAPGGKAEKGWAKVVRPAINALNERLLEE